MSPRHIAWFSIFLLALLGGPCLAGVAPQPIQQGAPQAETLGAQKTLIMLLNFSDVPNKPFTLEYIQDKVLSSAKSVDNFLKENSYGKMWLEVDFVDWQTLPLKSNDACPGGT